MHPIIFSIGSVNIYSYGVMLALAFVVVAFCIYKRSPSFGLDKNIMLDLLFGILIFGLIGARILHVFLDKEYYMKYPLEILKVYNGGLSVQGGMFAGLVFALFFLRKKKIDIFKAGDLFVPFIALGQSIGRIGCFLNGCCYGAVTSSCFGVIFSSQEIPRHPTQLYAALALFFVFIILLIFQQKKIFYSDLLYIYIMLYSFQRIIVDFFRVDISMLKFGMSVGQLISIVFFIIAFGGLLWKNKQNKNTN
ncbi:MAG: prolipoprotein diacylglyceryl transferase [Candidatus Omnitrophica bacterium]|nr:prolipoprotein diacylglyceryl transferase [Candidatus Omnitrophota bacterium]